MVGEAQAVRRCDPVGGCATRHQHQHQIVRARAVREIEGARCGLQSGFIRHWVAGLDHLDRLEWSAVTVPCDGKAREPRRRDFQFSEIMLLGDLAHRASALAGGEHDQPPFGRRRQ
jgi:hypothetical protein